MSATIATKRTHYNCRFFENGALNKMPEGLGICVCGPPSGVAIIVGFDQETKVPVYEPRGIYPPVVGAANACGAWQEGEDQAPKPSTVAVATVAADGMADEVGAVKVSLVPGGHSHTAADSDKTALGALEPVAVADVVTG